MTVKEIMESVQGKLETDEMLTEIEALVAKCFRAGYWEGVKDGAEKPFLADNAKKYSQIWKNSAISKNN